MALINHRSHEIHFKIVYYGASLGGKTTNLQMLHQRLPQNRRGRLLSISTDQERTLFFDFLPVELGQVSGFSTRFHLYTVPGQIYYRLSRRAVLQGLDAIVFVADSHEAREHANRDSLTDLWEHLATLGLSERQRADLPLIFQYNKRDLHRAMPIERMRESLNTHGAPEIESVASEGRGVSETLRAACKAVLARMVLGNASAEAAALPHKPAPLPGMMTESAEHRDGVQPAVASKPAPRRRARRRATSATAARTGTAPAARRRVSASAAARRNAGTSAATTRRRVTPTAPLQRRSSSALSTARPKTTASTPRRRKPLPRWPRTNTPPAPTDDRA